MKRKLKTKKIIIFIIFIIFVITSIIFIIYFLPKEKENITYEQEKITDFKNMTLKEVQEYAAKENLEIEISYDFSDTFSKDTVIESNLNDNILTLLVSKGSIPLEEYKNKKVNELGKVPIMMYHGIRNKTSNSTGTIGGNVDKDGYNRTPEAFREDLEFYYQNGYRMIRLNDYVNGIIDVNLGYSPIILTFDDGNADNFKVISKNSDGTLNFDPNSAIGILEEFKKKYPDFQVTATFFLNSGLCNQKEYNEDIMKWLVNNGYDIGNHTTTHANFSTISTTKTQEVVGKMYQKLDQIIPNQYVKIVALPFGSPYSRTHANYQYILNGEVDDYSYETIAALRVGWEPEVSCYDKTFNKTFLKRCRAYDNNGKEFDIEMVFEILNNNRYISDGEKDYITVPNDKIDKLGETEKKVITYEVG